MKIYVQNANKKKRSDGKIRALLGSEWNYTRVNPNKAEVGDGAGVIDGNFLSASIAEIVHSLINFSGSAAELAAGIAGTLGSIDKGSIISSKSSTTKSSLIGFDGFIVGALGSSGLGATTASAEKAERVRGGKAAEGDGTIGLKALLLIGGRGDEAALSESESNSNAGGADGVLTAGKPAPFEGLGEGDVAGDAAALSKSDDDDFFNGANFVGCK